MSAEALTVGQASVPENLEISKFKEFLSHFWQDNSVLALPFIGKLKTKIEAKLIAPIS